MHTSFSRRPARARAAVLVLALVGCGRLQYDPQLADSGADAASGRDASSAQDASPADAGTADAGSLDAGTADASTDAAAPDPLAVNDDEFTSGALDPRWTIHNSERLSSWLDADGLSLKPLTSNQWFESDEGSMVWLPIHGDFVITARITVVALGGGPPPGPGLEVGGVIARDPAVALGSHLWGAVGAEAGNPARESKSTTEGTSVFSIDPFEASAGVVRMCRVGPVFRTYQALGEGEVLVPHETYDRPDLPADLQVGVFGSDNGSAGDIVVQVAWVRFRTPSSLADCLE